jgi:hypothetical protein
MVPELWLEMGGSFKMMDSVRRTGGLLVVFAVVSTPLVFANSDNHEHDSVSYRSTTSLEEQEHVHASETMNISLISGVIVLAFVISTVMAGRFMRKGKVKVKTHHRLAYTTLTLAIVHGVYNLLVHYILQ